MGLIDTAVLVGAVSVGTLLALALTGAIIQSTTALQALAVATLRSAQAHEAGVALARAQIEMNRQLVEAARQRPAPVAIVSVAEGSSTKH